MASCWGEGGLVRFFGLGVEFLVLVLFELVVLVWGEGEGGGRDVWCVWGSGLWLVGRLSQRHGALVVVWEGEEGIG